MGGREIEKTQGEVLLWHIIVIHDNILTCRKYLLNLVPFGSRDR